MWSGIERVKETGPPSFAREYICIYMNTYICAQGGGRNSHSGRETHRRVYLVWIRVGGNSGWLPSGARAVGQCRCVCAHLVVRTMGEILRTRGHVDESSHPGRGAVNPFVLVKET